MCSDATGVWRLHGVLSREGECNSAADTAVTRPHPDVFADVVHLADWIRKIVGGKRSN